MVQGRRDQLRERAALLHQPERVRAPGRRASTGSSDRTFSDIGRGAGRVAPGLMRRRDAADVQQGPDRQPRGDRPAGHPRLPGAGVQTVAVYSEADRESLHVRFADDDVCIGPPPGRLSYLNIPSIIAAAEITGADAIHPGLRLPGRERRVRRDLRGLEHHVHRAHAATRSARWATRPRRGGWPRKPGVPTVPGSEGTIEDPGRGAARSPRGSASRSSSRRRRAAAARACASRNDAEQFAQLFSLAQNEALAAFGNGVVYVEKYLEHPRHVEIQVMGDTHGKVVHLGERDCSVQRRHQKLIEESPSPALTAELRAPDGRGGGARSRRTSATSAPAPSSSCSTPTAVFYFMEMNTRIQVEHPGHRDGDRLRPGEGADPRRGRRAAQPSRATANGLRGHAIECRVNAEDPYRNFQPCPGHITAYHPPGGPGVRVDTHVYAGYTVPPHYDSLLAKVIVHGNDRAEALAAHGPGARQLHPRGRHHHDSFLARVIRSPGFVAGEVDTRFLERESHLLKPEYELDVALPRPAWRARRWRGGRCSSSTSSAPPPPSCAALHHGATAVVPVATPRGGAAGRAPRHPGSRAGGRARLRADPGLRPRATARWR